MRGVQAVVSHGSWRGLPFNFDVDHHSLCVTDESNVLKSSLIDQVSLPAPTSSVLRFRNFRRRPEISSPMPTLCGRSAKVFSAAQKPSYVKMSSLRCCQVCCGDGGV